MTSLRRRVAPACRSRCHWTPGRASWKRRSPRKASSWEPLLARHARYRPLHTAVVVAPRAPDEREIRLTWREFDAYVNRLANALASLGVARGDRVATVLANSLELLATYWACAKLGAAAMPLSPLLTATGLASLLADAPPKVVLASSDQIPMLDDVRSATAVHAGVGADRRGGRRRAAGYRALRRRCTPARATPRRPRTSTPATC